MIAPLSAYVPPPSVDLPAVGGVASWASSSSVVRRRSSVVVVNKYGVGGVRGVRGGGGSLPPRSRRKSKMPF
jgi:hypothetical protein